MSNLEEFEIIVPGQTLEPPDIDYLRKRGISPEFAVKSGVRRLFDNEARKLNFQASLPLDQRDQGLQGLYLPSIDPFTGEERCGQLRTDYRFDLNGDRPKYLSRKGDPALVYFPHTATKEALLDAKIDLIITESPAKALSVAEAVEKSGDRLIVVGLNGVNGAWSREKKQWRDAGGKQQQRSTGPAKLIDDLKRIGAEGGFRGRTVYVLFDNDIGTKKQAQAYRKSRWSGSIGAEEKLVDCLRAYGADVRIVELPYVDVKLGADDFLVKYGWPSLLRHLHTNWVSARDIDRLLYEVPQKTWSMICSTDFVQQKIDAPKEYVEPYLVINEGVTLVSGPSKFGKTTTVLNLARSLTTGESFLQLHPTRRARTCYLQYEMSEWAIRDRLEKMGAAHEDLFVINPPQGALKLNFICDQGYKKGVETGNREHVYRLIRQLQDESISVLIIDSLGDALVGSELDETAMKDFFGVCRLIARSVPCGVVVVHHHRKQHDGMEDSPEEASGHSTLIRKPDSILSCFSKRRADDTFRFKLIYTLRHAPAPEVIELIRDGGNDSLTWKGIPWTDGTANLDRTLETLRKSEGAMSTDAVAKELGKHRTTAMRQLKQLVTQGLAEELKPGWWVVEGGR